MNVFEIESAITIGILVVLVAVKSFAFVSSLTFSAEAYSAAGKLTKPAWCAILGLGVLKLALHKARGTPLPEEWGTSSRDLVLE